MDSTSIRKHLTGISFQDPNQSNPTSHPTFDRGYWGWLQDLDRIGFRGGGVFGEAYDIENAQRCRSAELEKDISLITPFGKSRESVSDWCLM